MKQKIPFIILFLLSFIGVNSEFIVFSNESGNEPICENGVYQIKTADELKWFSDYVNSGFSDANAFICNDIDLSEICSENTESWIPIGRDYSVSFTGRFDGGNHTVSGLYIDGGELFNGFQHETERIPAHRLEELHQLGTALLGEGPENDCTIYRNVFRMAVDVDGQMGKLTGHARETMQREYDRLLRELNRLYTMNHAVKRYREAQHDRT